ncbi:MAG TPA: amino acid ABC transporter substrate-binding protein [Coleofasciculaceae cyanobacterium]
MLRRVAIALVSLLLTVVFSISGVAQTNPPESVLDRVARTGVLNAGTRTDAPPFAYLDAEGQWVGYSLEMLYLIQAGLEQQLNRQVQLNLVEVNMADRISKVKQREIDIVCSSTSLTANRELQSDFSVGYFQTGTQFLTKKGHVPSPPELRIGVVRGASNEYPLESQFRLAKLMRFANRAEGLQALTVGQIDALASDGILLEGLRQTLPYPEEFEIVPAQPFNLEVYACALPQGDPDFRALVNQQLIAFMQSVVNNDSRSVSLFDAWFGATGVAPVDRAQMLDYFRQTIASYEQNLQN